MSHSAHLLNTPIRISDLAALCGRWFTVAQAQERIPLPWLCMFEAADLRPCTLTFEQTESVEGVPTPLLRKFPILNPSTSVQAARRRLAKARPLFETLANSPATGARHWEEAMAALDALPLEYLTLDATAVLRMDDLKTGAMTLMAALADGEDALAAQRRLAHLDLQASAADNVGGLDGGFLAPAARLKHKRSPDEAKSWLTLLDKLNICNLTQTAAGYESLPLDLRQLDPPEAFWNDAEQLEKSLHHLSIWHDAHTVQDGKRHYATHLSNVSGQKVRVRRFAGFNKTQDGYAMANASGQWFSAQDFIDWYGTSPGGWIAPGATVADADNWGGDAQGFWAYWCENEAQERFMALAYHPASVRAAAEPLPASPYAPPLTWETLTQTERAAIQTNTETCKKILFNFSKQETSLDADGVQVLDKLLESLRAQKAFEAAERFTPAFGAYLGACVIHNIGGDWARHEGNLCVRFDDRNACFPFAKVHKQLDNGREGGDSVWGFYEAIAALRQDC